MITKLWINDLTGPEPPADTERDNVDRRVILSLNARDHLAWSELAHDEAWVDVVDQATGHQWAVWKAECGLGCRCAAGASPVRPS